MRSPRKRGSRHEPASSAASSAHGARADRTETVGRALERLVVDHHQLAVGGELAVELDRIDAEIERGGERRERVLGRAARRRRDGRSGSPAPDRGGNARTS